MIDDFAILLNNDCILVCYYYYYYYLLLFEFFTPALVYDFLLEFEWQQVSSGLQDSSQYSRLNNAVV